MLEIIIQIILAILLLIIMAILAYSIYDREYIKNINLFNTNKKETLILDGIYLFSEVMGVAETTNILDPNYFNLNPSVNQNGGAEYTFNFWLYYNLNNQNKKISNSDSSDKYIILFNKGDLNLINYNQFNYACDTDKGKKYLLIKNPLVKIKNDGTEIIVEYNNINYPDTFNSSAKKIGDCTSETNKNQNKLGIKEIDNNAYNKTWNMITIVMQENAKNEDELFVNRTNCKVYFNATLIADRSTLNNALSTENNADIYSTVMKKNSGNLYINPTNNLINYGLSREDYISNNITQITESDEITKDIPLKMADLTYFNYSLSQDEIIKLYKKKFNTKEAKLATSTIDSRKIKIGDRINYDMYNGEDTSITLPVKPI